jgi:hypothetical protein
MNDEVERIWKEAVIAWSRNYPVIWPEGRWKTTNNLSYNRRCSVRNSNRELQGHNSRPLRCIFSALCPLTSQWDLMIIIWFQQSWLSYIMAHTPVARERPRNEQRIQPLLCNGRTNKMPFLSNDSLNTFPRKRDAHNNTVTMETGVFSMWSVPRG